MAAVVTALVFGLLASGSGVGHQSAGLTAAEAMSSSPEDMSVLPLNTTNSTAQNMYVIKAIVYEIGILTEVGENDTSENLRNEQLDLTFFNPDVNGSTIDLGNIPLPVQANISGQVITGLAPVDFGSIFSNSTNYTVHNIVSDLPIAQTLQNLVPVGSIISPWDTLELNDSYTSNSTADNPGFKTIKRSSEDVDEKKFSEDSSPPLTPFVPLDSAFSIFPPQTFSIYSSSSESASNKNMTTEA